MHPCWCADNTSKIHVVLADTVVLPQMPSAKRRLRAEAVDSTDDEEDDEAIDRLTVRQDGRRTSWDSLCREADD